MSETSAEIWAKEMIHKGLGEVLDESGEVESYIVHCLNDKRTLASCGIGGEEFHDIITELLLGYFDIDIERGHSISVGWFEAACNYHGIVPSYLEEEAKLMAPVIMQERADELMTEAERVNSYLKVKKGNEYLNEADLRAQEEILAAKKAKRAMKVQPVREKRVKKKENWRKSHAVDVHGSKSRDFTLEDFDLEIAGEKLVDNGTLQLSHGRRYGLVGRNGVGKTTLLRAITDGELPVPAHLSILHVEQEVVGDNQLAIDCVLEVDGYRMELLQREKELSGTTDNREIDELSKIYSELDRIEAASAEGKASKILSGLGFTQKMQQSPTKSFSGGWRMRLALARALFCVPDILLLDEPTNMLDIQAVVWLEQYLLKWKNTLLVVSHDRGFLNVITTDIAHLHGKKITMYRGNYDSFEKIRMEKLRTQQKAYEAQQRFKAHVQKFVDRFRFNANRAPLVQSRLKMLAKLEPTAGVLEDPTLSFSFPDPTNMPNSPLVKLVDVYFGYGLTPEEALHPSTPMSGKIASKGLLFKNMEMYVTNTSRVAIVGENGAGKSTLLHLITKEIEPCSGYVVHENGLRMAVFSQHHVDQLDLNLSPLEFASKKFPGMTDLEYRRCLGKYGVTGNMALQVMETLSGGQKSRVVFALMAMEKPHLMVLDEVTNHLDIETVDVLANALNSFQGAFVLVTHDERLIRLACDELWVIKKGAISKYDGDFDSYKASLEV